MPTYEYRCKGCGSDLEVVQSFTDDALTTCDACGGELRKVFGSVGIAFKGSGFYKTDSRGGSSATSDGGSGTSSEGAGSGAAAAASSDSGGAADTPKADKKADGKTDKKQADKGTKAPAAASAKP